MRNAASAFIMVVAAGLTLSAGTATNAGIISSLAPPTSRSTAAPAGTGRPATTQPTAATAIERRPPVSTVPTRFDAFDGLFALTLPPGWTMISRRDRANAYTGWTDASYDSSFSLYVWPSDAGLHPGTLLRRSRGAMELFFKDLRVLEESDLPLGPLECARLLAEGTDKDGVRLRLLALVAKNDQRTLELSFYVPVAKFDALRPTLEAMLKSFELTGTIVESANGKFTVMLPPDVKLVQDPKQPDRQHCRLGSDAELVFDVYHASAAYNAASLMERDRGNLVGKFPDYHVLQERKAPPSDLITGLVNGYMLLDEWTQPDGSRWRSGSFYYDDSNFIFTFHLYAKVATFMSLWHRPGRHRRAERDALGHRLQRRLRTAHPRELGLGPRNRRAGSPPLPQLPGVRRRRNTFLRRPSGGPARRAGPGRAQPGGGPFRAGD